MQYRNLGNSDLKVPASITKAVPNILTPKSTILAADKILLVSSDATKSPQSNG